MMIRKTILSALSASAALFACAANAVEPADITADTPVQVAAIKNCPSYSTNPDYVYEWRVDANGCRYPVFISKG